MHIHNTYIEKGNKSIRLNKKDRRSSRSKTTIMCVIRKKINKKKRNIKPVPASARCWFGIDNEQLFSLFFRRCYWFRFSNLYIMSLHLFISSALKRIKYALKITIDLNVLLPFTGNRRWSMRISMHEFSGIFEWCAVFCSFYFFWSTVGTISFSLHRIWIIHDFYYHYRIYTENMLCMNMSWFAVVFFR